MRLAVVEPSSQGGLLHYAVQLADALAQRGHTVDLLVPREHELSGWEGPARMKALLTPPTPAPGGMLERVRVIRRARVAIRLVRSWGRINWEVRRNKYDAVILTSDIDLWPMAAAVLALTVGRGSRRIGAVGHSARAFNRWSGGDLFVSSPILSLLLRRLYPRLDALFVHGESSQAEFESTWPASELVVIPHGDERIFAGEPPAASKEKRLLFFGEWRKVKGLTVLMQAFEELLTRCPDACLTIAGSPCPVDLDPQEVADWAARHSENVEVIDHYIPVSDVPRIFGAARAVVTPYLVGYQSGVVHIAMTMARPVVASEVGDLTTVVVDGETGLTVAPGDPHALADALQRILSDADFAEALGREGRRRLLQNSSWELVAQKVEDALRAGP
jgi:glycosyltransferase involved in cell wall biosynthesis